MTNKQQIRKLVWDMACSTSEIGQLFLTPEYNQLRELGFTIARYKSTETDGFLSDENAEFQAMFALFIYHSMS